VGLFGGPGGGVLPGRAALRGGRRSSGTPPKAIDATALASPPPKGRPSPFVALCSVSFCQPGNPTPHPPGCTSSQLKSLFCAISIVGRYDKRRPYISFGVKSAPSGARSPPQRPWRAKGGVTFSRHPQRQTPPTVTISANGSRLVRRWPTLSLTASSSFLKI